LMSGSARPELRKNLRGERLDLPRLVGRVADGVEHEIGTAGLDETLELLRALIGRADDAVLLGERPKILGVALREPVDPHALGALVVLAERDEGQVPLREAVERAARRRRGRLDLGEALLVALRLDDIGDPAVALAPGAGERRIGAAADPDRRRGRLDGLGVYAHAFELREAALEAGRRIAPERPHDVDALGDARTALLVGNAAGFEFLRVLPAHAHAKDEAAARERIEGRCDLGGNRRMAQGEEIDADPQLDPARDAYVRGEERQ